MKISYIVLFLLVLIIKCQKNESLNMSHTDQAEKEHLQERINEILKKEKWDNQKILTKKEFAKIFRRLFELGREEVEKKQVVELALKDIPEEIDINKIVDYLDPTKIQEIFAKVLSPENLQNVSTQSQKNKKENNPDL